MSRNNNTKKKTETPEIKENMITLSDDSVRKIYFAIIGFPNSNNPIKGLKNIVHPKMTVGLKYKLNTILTELTPCFMKTNVFIEENMEKEGQEAINKILMETTDEYNIKKLPITSISDFPDTGELDFLYEIIDSEK